MTDPRELSDEEIRHIVNEARGPDVTLAACRAVIKADRERRAAAALPCGHPPSLLLHSAETGEPLYCELCDDKSGRRDAEQMEQKLRAELAEARAALAADRERRAAPAGCAPAEPAVLQLPPLTDVMYHACRGNEYEFTAGGPESITGYLDDDMLDEIWDQINTALRCAGVPASTPAAQPVATLACPICGHDGPHGHVDEEIVGWLQSQAGRFLPEWESRMVIRLGGDESAKIIELRRMVEYLEECIKDAGRAPPVSYAAAQPVAVEPPKQWLWRVFNLGFPRGHEDSNNEWGDWSIISAEDAQHIAGDDENKVYEFVPYLPTPPTAQPGDSQ